MVGLQAAARVYRFCGRGRTDCLSPFGTVFGSRAHLSESGENICKIRFVFLLCFARLSGGDHFLGDGKLDAFGLAMFSQ